MRLVVEGGGAQVQVQSALLGFVIAGALQEHLGLAAPEATRGGASSPISGSFGST